MTLPSVLLGFLLATVAGLLFHFIRGGPVSRIALYVVASWISFAAGQLLSMLTGWQWGRVGTLNLVPALAATALGLLAASVLAGSPGRWKQVLEGPPDPDEPET